MREALAHVFNGSGVEVCAGEHLSPVAPNAQVKHAAFEVTDPSAERAGLIGPQVNIVLRQPGKPPKSLSDGSPLSFVLLNAEALERSSDPLTMIESWEQCLRPRGVILLGVRIRSGPSAMRITTPLAHLWSDYKRRRTSACHEHILADRLERSPDSFVDPTNVALVISYLATMRQAWMDADSWALVSNANREAVEKSLAHEPADVRHHSLTLPVLLAGIDALNDTGQTILVPCDIAISRDADPQHLLVCRKYPSSILNRSDGRLMLQDEVAMVRRQLSTLKNLG